MTGKSEWWAAVKAQSVWECGANVLQHKTATEFAVLPWCRERKLRAHILDYKHRQGGQTEILQGFNRRAHTHGCTSSSQAAPLKASQTAPPSGDQVFKHPGCEAQFLFKGHQLSVSWSYLVLLCFPSAPFWNFPSPSWVSFWSFFSLPWSTPHFGGVADQYRPERKGYRRLNHHVQKHVFLHKVPSRAWTGIQDRQAFLHTLKALFLVPWLLHWMKASLWSFVPGFPLPAHLCVLDAQTTQD